MSAAAAAAAAAAAGCAQAASSRVSVRVAAYNVLAQCLAKSSFFPYSGHGVLSWRHRWPRIAATIDSLDADVLCLSEVDEEKSYQRHFAERGYDTLFAPRAGKQYGNLLAWRRDKFRLVTQAVADMDDLAAFAVAHPALAAGPGPLGGAPAPAAVAAPAAAAGAAPTPEELRAHYTRSCVAVFAALEFVGTAAVSAGHGEAASPHASTPACNHAAWRGQNSAPDRWPHRSRARRHLLASLLN